MDQRTIEYSLSTPSGAAFGVGSGTGRARTTLGLPADNNGDEVTDSKDEEDNAEDEEGDIDWLPWWDEE